MSAWHLMVVPEDGWQDRAACKGMDPDLFFAERGHGRAEDAYATARRACGGCEVRYECLEFALATNETAGMWGGLNPTERRVIDRKRRQAGALRPARKRVS